MADGYFLSADIRGLFEAFHEFEGGSLYGQLLAPWVDANPDVRAWLTAFATRSGDPIPPASDKEMWELYALSRVSQTLLLRFQSGRADGTDWPGPQITLAEYTAFMVSLGFTVADVNQFSPFYHEIVAVEQHPDDIVPTTVSDVVWPCVMLGNMLFSRAGVRVTSGRRFIDKPVAETSVLYWAFWRKNRPYQDLSHGWGSNSQWRTTFRHDYRIADTLHFNVDEKPVPPEDDGLTPAERIELVTHRCFVTCEKPHNDLWPYDLWHNAPAEVPES